MKRYETNTALHLTRRVPVIVRVDGRAFHTYTRGCAKPFDSGIMDAMGAAAQAVLDGMQGGRLAYVQSDEASFLFVDYDRIESEPWFDYDLQKVVSLSAATMTMAFNRARWLRLEGLPGVATFDARAFNIPKEEVANYFLWRAKDWRRNSVQMLAEAHFSPKQLYGKPVPEMLEMLLEAGHDWHALTDRERCGQFLRQRAAADASLAYAEPTWATVNAIVEPLLEPRAADGDEADVPVSRGGT